MNADRRQVALFSIPGCVTFPHTHVPLHVFEPRYRDMVNHCISNAMMMGVCHTQKVVHEKRVNQSLEETLSSNQSTYKPHSIFSIGEVELIDTLPDGRMQIVVHMSERVQLQKEIQTLPFSIVEITPLHDIDMQGFETEALQLQEKIVTRIRALFAGNAGLLKYFESPELQSMNAKAFSYNIFSVVQFAPEAQQEIL